MSVRRLRETKGSAMALGLSGALAIGLLVAVEPACASDWDSGSGELGASLLLDVRIKQPTERAGAKRWAVPREIRFRGKRVNNSWRTYPDGTQVRYKTGVFGGKRLVFLKAGSSYLSQVPHFDQDTVTWTDVDFRRPLPIQGSTRVEYAVYEKVRGRYGQWKCSVYYREVCRWIPGRRAVPKHRVGGIVSRGYVHTKIGPDTYAKPRYLGRWFKPLDEIPPGILTNPAYPIWNNDTSMYGRGPLNNVVKIKWTRKNRFTP